MPSCHQNGVVCVGYRVGCEKGDGTIRSMQGKPAGKISHRPIVFVDVETTGLSARDGHILEIGAVRVEKGEVVAKMKQLLDPGVDVPYHITRITGITSDDLRGAPQFAQVVDEFERFMDDAIFAAHNVDFDYSFFTEEYRRLGQKLRYDRFCTAKLSRMLEPNHRKHSLDAIIERRGYEVENRHRAYDDAYVLYQYFSDQLAAQGIALFNTVEKLLVKTKTEKTIPALTYVPFFE